MRHFIAYENNMKPRLNDPTYRRLPLTGCTYNEDELRKWASGVRSWDVSVNATIPEIVAGIAKGGWGLMEILS